MIKKCSNFCERDGEFTCKECGQAVCIVHVRFLLPHGNFDGEYCSAQCIDKFMLSDRMHYDDDTQEAIAYLIEKKEFKTKATQKKSKEITTIELNYEDNINLRRILYLAEHHFKLNIKLRETLLKVKYQT